MADNTNTGNRTRSYAEIRAARDAKQQSDPPSANGKPVRKKESWWRSLLIAFLIAGVLRTFFIEAFRIPTGSMKNTLLVGDHLFVNKIGYFIESPKYIPFTTIEIPHVHIKTWGIHRGDVVVFEYPGDRDDVVPREKDVKYIKRCIGEPGDVIQIVNKQVYVNGRIFPNPKESILEPDTQKVGFVEANIFPKGAQWNRDNFGPLRVPKAGDTIMLTKESLDRWQVFIEREGHKVELASNDQVLVDGKPTLEYRVQRDYLWMMGDNRDDSEDSRFWGFAPVDNVVGSGLIIYWSWYNPPSSGNGDGYDPDEVQNTHVRWGRMGRIIH
ncbi:MAG: signal peptidase I [Bacteroidota bacterium]|nr:signal peptidase I [Bacteroidota bacterium]MDP4234568.1 signal peptidase I [Bacteroidota bacterium]MDP4243697.1 signal peptidase I [Bacteroidota bacterium]MDP4288355.1 signal peptidase I [Bacteroidota bacterium]